ncbi:MAG TPA: acyl-CoA desaturase [Planctomycetaceae bacterium]|nr:acyl-CoA desaturase [Planctomycetaceae bacterium]
MSKKNSRRSTRRHYRPATESAVRPATETDVPELLNGGAPKEASSRLKWNSGREHVAKSENVSWLAAGWLVAMHVIALAAPWTFTWHALVAMFVMHWFCGGIGICLGYHRLLTHGGFGTYNWVRRSIAAIGCLAGEGPPLMWVSNHRLHHARSDQDGDPHSPHDGSWWSHMFWLAYRVGGSDQNEYHRKWSPDLYRDRFIRSLDYFFFPINVACAAATFGIGYLIAGWAGAVSWLIWAFALRMVLVLHATWLVNSASHMWGYRNYETRDDSRNNWWVALITYGEGWHNNHHAHPRMAKHGHKWWEFDVTYNTIRLMRAVGLAWDVVDYRNRAEKREAEAAS